MLNIIERIQKISKIDLINYLLLIYSFSLSFPIEIKRVVSISLILLWLTDKTHYTRTLPKTNLFKAFGLFILFASLSYFWSEASIKEVLLNIKRYWYFLPLFITFKYLKKEYVKYSLSFFLMGMLASEILSYGNYFSIWKIGLGNPTDPTVFMHHTLYGVFLTITSYLLLSMFFEEKIYRKKILYFLFFLTVTINLLINSGRTGYFTFFISSFILVFVIIKPNIKNILFFIITLSFTILFAYYGSSNFKKRIHLITNDVSKITKDYNFNSSVGARIGFWLIGGQIIKENPIIGVGISNNIKYKNQLIEKMDKNEQLKFEHIKELVHYHNTHLSIITQYGILGYLIFLYILYTIVKIQIRDKLINTIKISVVVIFFIGSFADILFYLNTTMSLFAFFIGLVLSQYKWEKIKES